MDSERDGMERKAIEHPELKRAKERERERQVHNSNQLKEIEDG